LNRGGEAKEKYNRKAKQARTRMEERIADLAAAVSRRFIVCRVDLTDRQSETLDQLPGRRWSRPDRTGLFYI
jgi:hypothetical protein